MQQYLRFFFIVLIVSSVRIAHAQSVGINNTGAVPHASSMLDIQSTTRGVLIPRMTTAERNAITSPATGLLVFDNSTTSFWFRKSSGWQEMLDASNSPWMEDGSLNLRTKNGGNVSITPGAPLGFGKLNVVSQSPETNTNESIIQVIRSTSGTAASGLSGSIDFYNEVSNGGFPATARIVCESTNTTPGNHSATMEFFTAAGGVLASQLYLGVANVGIGTSTPSIFSKFDVNGTINTNGKITRNSISGTSNLVPLCYGAVDVVGNVTSGTGNFSVLKTSIGVYYISDGGFDDNCIVIATPRAPNIGTFSPRMIASTSDGNHIVIRTYNGAGSAIDCGFHFMVYKQ